MRRILGIAAVCAVGASAWGQQVVPAIGGSTGGGGGVDNIVYDNSANTLGFLINGANAELGDGVTLAGTDRVVTNINLLIHVNGGAAGVADVQVRMYAGGDAGGGDPGALLWDGGLMTGFALDAGLGSYDFAVPNVTVPDEVTWTLELSNLTTAGPTGSRFVAPPTVGSSEDWVWNHTGGVWSQQVFGVGVGNNSYGAVITAIAGSTCPCACDFDPDPACNIFDFLAFQTAFVAGDPCACDFDPDPACNIFDFLAFQTQFVAGCP